MSARYRHIADLDADFAARGDAVRRRLEEFRRVGEGDDRALFRELCFCLLAVQTKARTADAAVRAMEDAGLLWSGDERALATFLWHRTRFHNHKAAYLCRARARFSEDGEPLGALVRGKEPEDARLHLARTVDGIALKEASHFLRNVGRGENLAILDRHILRNLAHHGVIPRVPASLTERRYLGIEGRMRAFADHLGWSVGVLDLLLWSRETGEVFK